MRRIEKGGLRVMIKSCILWNIFIFHFLIWLQIFSFVLNLFQRILLKPESIKVAAGFAFSMANLLSADCMHVVCDNLRMRVPLSREISSPRHTRVSPSPSFKTVEAGPPWSIRSRMCLSLRSVRHKRTVLSALSPLQCVSHIGTDL